jgi:hypothetical protein
MSCVSGTNVVNDGLVFAFDMSNTQKSWKGRPTENEVNNPNFLNGTADWQLSARGGSTHNDVYTVLEENGLSYLNVHWERHSGSGNSWAQLRNNRRYTDAVEYTYSGQFRVNYITGVEGQIRHSATTNDYWTPGRRVRSLSSSDVQKGWQDFQLTRTFITSYTRSGIVYDLSGMFEIYSGSQPNTGDVLDFDIRFIQVEKNGFSTPFVDGTRSNTEAIIDLTGENVITASNLSYNSDGTINFDGTDDYIDLQSDTLISPANQGWAAEYWFNTSSASTLQHFNSAEADDFNANWLAIYGNKLAVWNVSPGYWKYGSTNIQNNTWYQAVFICDAGGTNMRFYINGTQEAGTHVGNSWTSIYSALKTRYIGRYEYNGSYGRYFVGKIDKVKLYNRALSATEIKQNFEATRSIYGI